MEMSIRDAEARFTRQLPQQPRGEQVVVTKFGRPFVELVAARSVSGMDFEQAEAVRRTLGLDNLEVRIPAEFDDPAFSRQVLGLPD